ncbi:hypothetical protein D3C77_478860 [compost metagenome]
MTAHLVLGLFPARIAVGCALQGPKRNFICRLVSHDINREADFKELVCFIPVNMGLEVDTRAIMIENHILRNDRLAYTPTEPKHVLSRPRPHNAFLQQHNFPCRLLFITVIDIPCIP